MKDQPERFRPQGALDVSRSTATGSVDRVGAVKDSADQSNSSWRVALQRKTCVTEAWDWKKEPARYVQALFLPFGVRPDVSAVNAEFPERFIAPLAKQHGLHLYDPPTVEGSDAYGFILSNAELDEREIQQIEADYWGQQFDDVYDSTR